MIPIISESFAQEGFSILETGIISTATDDYDISGQFEVRVIGDGDIIRMKGITVSGNPYYAYQRVIDGEPAIFGKIFIDGAAVPLVNKAVEQTVQEETVEEQEPEKSNLRIAMQHPAYGYFTQAYNFVVKIFDSNQNPNSNFISNIGKLSGVNVELILTDSQGKILKTFEGVTDSQGIFDGSHTWKYEDPLGQYNVTVIADNGKVKTVQQFETDYNGYHPYYSGSQNP